MSKSEIFVIFLAALFGWLVTFFTNSLEFPNIGYCLLFNLSVFTLNLITAFFTVKILKKIAINDYNRN